MRSSTSPILTRLFPLALALLLAVSIIGCSGGTGTNGGKKEGDAKGKSNDQNPSGDEKKVTIAISVQSMANPFFKVIADTVTAEAAKHDFEVLVRDGKHDVSVQKQQVAEFIGKRVDAIILCPKDTKAIGSVVIEANKASIPVFTVDTKCEDPNGKVVFHVGTDNYQGGLVAGQAMIDALGDAGGEVAVLQFTDAESCIDRVKGFEKKIEEHNAKAANKIKIVTHLECGGEEEKGQEVARDAMNSHPGLVGIFAINDPAALGAYAAVAAEKKTDKITIVGFDGQPQAKEAVDAGKLFDTPLQFPDRMAIECVKAIVDHLNGKKIEKPSMLILTEPYRKKK